MCQPPPPPHFYINPAHFLDLSSLSSEKFCTPSPLVTQFSEGPTGGWGATMFNLSLCLAPAACDTRALTPILVMLIKPLLHKIQTAL